MNTENCIVFNSAQIFISRKILHEECFISSYQKRRKRMTRYRTSDYKIQGESIAIIFKIYTTL